MTMLESTFSWNVTRACTPDRLRSFLQYVAQRDLPLRFGCGDGNLYTTSESLMSGALRDIPMTGFATARNVTFAVVFAGTHCDMSLAFLADRSVLDLLSSEPGMSILCAGARMLAATDGFIDVTKDPGETVRPHPLTVVSHRIAVWTASKAPPQQKNLLLVDEQWDGACVWLRRPLSQAFLRQALLSSVAFTADAKQSRNSSEEPALLHIVEEALRSPDWRTRTMAMIAAVRRNLTSLVLSVRQMDIPDSGVPGVTNELRHNLLAMQRAALLLLSGMPVPPVEASAPATRDGMRAHLLRVIAGESLAFEEDFSALVRTLVPQESRV